MLKFKQTRKRYFSSVLYIHLVCISMKYNCTRSKWMNACVLTQSTSSSNEYMQIWVAAEYLFKCLLPQIKYLTSPTFCFDKTVCSRHVPRPHVWCKFPLSWIKGISSSPIHVFRTRNLISYKYTSTPSVVCFPCRISFGGSGSRRELFSFPRWFFFISISRRETLSIAEMRNKGWKFAFVLVTFVRKEFVSCK